MLLLTFNGISSVFADDISYFCSEKSVHNIVFLMLKNSMKIDVNKTININFSLVSVLFQFSVLNFTQYHYGFIRLQSSWNLSICIWFVDLECAKYRVWSAEFRRTGPNTAYSLVLLSLTMKGFYKYFIQSDSWSWHL